jgi:hypothetical protein
VVGVVWLGNIATMMIMYWLIGYVRLLGLSHVLWWTPLFAWLLPLLRTERPAGRFRIWVYLLVASDLASLAIDYVDVFRYLAGDREPA